MAKKLTKIQKAKRWLDENPKVKSAINTFWTGFIAVFLIQVKDVDWNNLSALLENGAAVGVFLAAIRAGLIAGISALGRWMFVK